MLLDHLHRKLILAVAKVGSLSRYVPGPPRFKVLIGSNLRISSTINLRLPVMQISYESIITSYVYRWDLRKSDSHIIKFLNPDAKF